MNPECVWGPEQDKNSMLLMKTVLASEKPDYVYVLSIRRVIADEVECPLLLVF